MRRNLANQKLYSLALVDLDLFLTLENMSAKMRVPWGELSFEEAER